MWQKSELERRLWSLIEPVAVHAGRELVDLSFRRESGGWVLRLLVDQPGGIDLDGCAALSREVSYLLDVEDIFDHPYRLEVSSPGLERPLTRPEHFQRYAGKEIRIHTVLPRQGGRKFAGRLLGLAEGVVKISTEQGELEFRLDEIEKANLVFRWE